MKREAGLSFIPITILPSSLISRTVPVEVKHRERRKCGRTSIFTSGNNNFITKNAKKASIPIQLTWPARKIRWLFCRSNFYHRSLLNFIFIFLFFPLLITSPLSLQLTHKKEVSSDGATKVCLFLDMMYLR